MKQAPQQVIRSGGAGALTDAERAEWNELERGKWSKIRMENEPEPSPPLVNRVLTTLYGKIPPEELKRVGVLSLTLFFIIGGYWLLRSLKDTVLITINGVDCIHILLYIPKI